MKTRYGYIHFEQKTDWVSPRQVWLCRNNRSKGVLAQLHWDEDWKQYVAVFNKNAIFSADCLKDIAEFMET